MIWKRIVWVVVVVVKICFIVLRILQQMVSFLFLLFNFFPGVTCHFSPIQNTWHGFKKDWPNLGRCEFNEETKRWGVIQLLICQHPAGVKSREIKLKNSSRKRIQYRCQFSQSTGIMIRWLYPLQRGKTPDPQNEVSWLWQNCIWWWGSITPRSNLTQSGSTC